MKAKLYLFTAIAAALLAAGMMARAQEPPEPAPAPQTPATAPATLPERGEGSNGPAVPVPSTIPGQLAKAGAEAAALPDAVKKLLEFKESDVKFDVSDLMDILRDRRHEGWVLAAYPDPKTGQPLIGAGFSLDLPARDHVQQDALNPHPFLEPSSADLWQAAGLPPARLDGILHDFNARMAQWNKKRFRRQIGALEPQISEGDAAALLRIGIIQSIYNARAYSRNFDGLSASQQMAMTQLVYQMGVNLQEFSNFLTLINRDDAPAGDLQAAGKADAEYWHNVQMSLVQSQWARVYRERAKSVIAMLDPNYVDNPTGAERNVGAVLRPARRHGKATLSKASYTRPHATARRRRASRTRKN